MARIPDAGSPRGAAFTAVVFVAGATLAWGFTYGRIGHGGDDGGFILALAWRILDGQIPYRDFVYVRPPLSPLLHAATLLLLPATTVVLAERFLFYTAVATYSWIAAGLLVAEGDRGVARPLLALTGFVVSVLWFPPMPWHTVDGVLLAVLGVACLPRDARPPSAGSRLLAALGGALFVAAALAKQPYALVLPCALGWLALRPGRRGLAAAALGAVAAGSLVLGASVALGVAGAAWSQIAGATSPGALLSAGVLDYGRAVVRTVVPPLGVWLAAHAAGRAFGVRLPRVAFPWLLVVWMFGACLAGIVLADGFEPPLVDFPAALLVLGGLATLREWRVGAPAAPLTALLLVIAWCASISWGWQTPALFATPILFASFDAARHHAGAAPGRLASVVLACGLVLQFAGYRQPYADAPRAALVHDLGTVLPRLGGIRSSAGERARLAEFRHLHARYGQPSFTVLPGFPLAHFVVGVAPPPGVDWARNSEIAGLAASLARRLEIAGTRAFVERDRRVCREGPGCSALTAHVVERWTRVARGIHFDVYVPPGAPDDPLGEPSSGATVCGAAPIIGAP